VRWRSCSAWRRLVRLQRPGGSVKYTGSVGGVRMTYALSSTSTPLAGVGRGPAGRLKASAAPSCSARPHAGVTSTDMCDKPLQPSRDPTPPATRWTWSAHSARPSRGGAAVAAAWSRWRNCSDGAGSIRHPVALSVFVPEAFPTAGAALACRRPGGAAARTGADGGRCEDRALLSRWLCRTRETRSRSTCPPEDYVPRARRVRVLRGLIQTG